MTNQEPSNKLTNTEQTKQTVLYEHETQRITISLDLPREKREALSLQIDEPFTLGDGIWGIFGKSGTGKSTLLKALAGLYKRANYRFSIQDKTAEKPTNINTYRNLPASENPCVYVGSESILFDHLNVADNLRLVQKQGGFSQSTKLSYHDIVELCGIQSLLIQNVSALSSGESQRVKFARALLSGKPCILLDEAFSALDWPTRRYFSTIIANLHQQYGLAFVLVSHSLRELALTCSQISECCEGKLVKSDSASNMLEYLQFSNATGHDATLTSSKQSEPYLGDVFSLLKLRVLSNDEHAKLAECALLGTEKARVVVRANTPLNIEQDYKLTLDADKVSLSTHSVTNTSMLNSLRGKVVAIKHYNSVVLVSLLVDSQTLHAAISIRSFKHLDIKLDVEIFALFKAL